MAFDEEHIDPHGECAAEIHRLQEQSHKVLETICDYVFGPPGPNVTPCEYKAWQAILFGQLVLLANAYMAAKKENPK